MDQNEGAGNAEWVEEDEEEIEWIDGEAGNGVAVADIINPQPEEDNDEGIEWVDGDGVINVEVEGFVDEQQEMLEVDLDNDHDSDTDEDSAIDQTQDKRLFPVTHLYISDTEDDAQYSLSLAILKSIDETCLAPVEIPLLSQDQVFIVPFESIDVHDHGRVWDNVFGFICTLNNRVVGVDFASIYWTSLPIKRVLLALASVKQTILDYLPGELDAPAHDDIEVMHAQFKLWNQSVKTNGQLIQLIVGMDASQDCINEIAFYFGMSFGSLENVSYGFQHEVNFMIFLYCLVRVGVLMPSDYQSLVAIVFLSYRDIIDQLHTTFGINSSIMASKNAPPTSEMLTYVFGSAELIGRQNAFPTRQMHLSRTLSQYAVSSYFFKRLNRMTVGGSYDVDGLFLLDSARNDWACINRNLLGYCHKVFKMPNFARKFRAGSIVRW